VPAMLKGKCPHCQEPIWLRASLVNAASAGYTGARQELFAPDDEEPYGTTGAAGPRDTLNRDGNGSTPSPDIRSGGQRPVCPACGLDGARLEQTAKKSGRPFTAFKCINSECDQNDEIIAGTFRWGKAAA